MRIVSFVLLSMVAAGLSACAASPGAASATISGRVTYRQRIALPVGARLRVELVDISLADAPAVTLGAYTHQPHTQVPLPFSITYDPAELQDHHTYALQAEIRDGQGKLWFRNTSVVLVLTQGQPTDNITILLEMVSSP